MEIEIVVGLGLGVVGVMMLARIASLLLVIRDQSTQQTLMLIEMRGTLRGISESLGRLPGLR